MQAIAVVAGEFFAVYRHEDDEASKSAAIQHGFPRACSRYYNHSFSGMVAFRALELIHSVMETRKLRVEMPADAFIIKCAMDHIADGDDNWHHKEYCNAVKCSSGASAVIALVDYYYSIGTCNVCEASGWIVGTARMAIRSQV